MIILIKLSPTRLIRFVSTEQFFQPIMNNFVRAVHEKWRIGVFAILRISPNLNILVAIVLGIWQVPLNLINHQRSTVLMKHLRVVRKPSTLHPLVRTVRIQERRKSVYTWVALDAIVSKYDKPPGGLHHLSSPNRTCLSLYV